MTNSDEELLCHWVKSIPVKINEGEWHSAFMSGEKGLESLRGKPRTDLLQYIYHRTFCSCCRERVVKLMHKKKVLTDSILQECLYDSYSETQSFAKSLILKNPKSEALQNDQS